MKEKGILNALRELNENHQIDVNVLTEILKHNPKDVSKCAVYSSNVARYSDIYKNFIDVYEIVYKRLKSAAIIVKNKKDIVKYMDYWCEKLNCESDRIIEIFKYAESALINQTFLMILNYGMENITDIKALSEILLAYKILNESDKDSTKELYDAITNPETNEIGIIEVYEKEYYKSSDFTKRMDRIAGTKKEMILSEILKLKGTIHHDYDETYEESYSRDDYYTFGSCLSKKFTHPKSRAEGISMYKKALSMEKALSNLPKPEDGFILYNGKVLKISNITLIRNGIDPSFVNWKPFNYSIQEKSNKSTDKEIKTLSKRILKRKLN